ncbi:MAG: hypothetical protein LBH32_00725 [Dysgonamonadaceae bacterium]|jgi:hypothetical protein|nr:hypothetical protein [Dysgonamonadaceae bacterium]
MKSLLSFLFCFVFCFTACYDNCENGNTVVVPQWGCSVLEGYNASEFNFLPSNTAEENVKALQKALDSVKVIYVNMPGVYDLDSTIYLNSNTRIAFGKGVYIRKQQNKNGKGAEYVFINRGAFDRTYNEKIEISGLNLICNGLDDNHSAIQGLVGQISFFYVRNLIIKNLTCTDLLKGRFCIQVAEFENVHIENVHIEGDKDGVHLGAGKDFVIRNGFFKTFDDPIALNAHDYDVSNPTVGWIENGLIENCYDLPAKTTTGFFCRILAGSWVDWYSGMKLQKSDIVVNNNRLYRVIASPDGKEYTSYTAPDHTSGFKTIDGIRWYMLQEGAIYNAGCRNIHFKDIYLEKDRDIAFSVHFDMGKWSRSYYPNSTAPVQSKLVFENIRMNGKLGNLIYSRTPVDEIKFINLNWKQGNISLNSVEGLNYCNANIEMEKTAFNPQVKFNVNTDANRSIKLKIINSTVGNSDYKLPLRGNVTVVSSDVPYYFMQ